MFSRVVPAHHSRTENLCVLKQTQLLYLLFTENYLGIEELAANLYKGLSTLEKRGRPTQQFRRSVCAVGWDLALSIREVPRRCRNLDYPN